ncbi:MAG: hypothetical protein HYX25_06560 [Candidatus Solibacter usitatus]|nr:hypothetical protein [Candidatus Solibacter usitatus]
MRAVRKRRRGDPEAGFVMLMVFVMAAAVAIMLYMELPRVAFEAQRNKEALLIERGEQYKRAIQLYFRKFKRYPTSMEQLESTNNLRFLRRRYKDPLTGKDEWRLIHIGPTGAFIDSLTNKPGGNDKDKKPQNLNTFITEGGGIGAGLPATGANNGQPPRRASEQAALNAALDPTAGGAIPNPGANPVVGGQLLNPQGGSPFPTSIPAGVVPVSAFNLPAQTGTPGIAQDGSMQPAGSGFGSSANQGFGNSGFGNSGGQGFGQQQGQGFGQQQGFNAGQAGANQAANLMLSQLLTTPRNTNNFVTPGPGLGTPAVGGGIAGVASTVEKTGIKIYNERSKYNEWEFIYDFGKDRTGMGQLAGQLGSADPRLANSGQNVQSGFGGQGGIGQAGQGGGFGGQAGAQAGFGGAGGFGRNAAGQAGATGGIGSSAGGVGSGYGGGIGSGFTPPPGTQTQPQPVRQPATPQQQPAPQPHPQQAQPAQPQPVQPPQPAPPPPPEPTPAAPEPTPEPAPAPDPQTAEPPVPDPPPVVETPPQ